MDVTKFTCLSSIICIQTLTKCQVFLMGGTGWIKNDTWARYWFNWGDEAPQR